jgi:hypothetical protein
VVSAVLVLLIIGFVHCFGHTTGVPETSMPTAFSVLLSSDMTNLLPQNRAITYA